VARDGDGSEASVTLRTAVADDLEFLVDLANDDSVEPYLGARQPRDRAEIGREIARTTDDGDRFGRLVVEVDGERVGSVTWELVNEVSSIVRLERLALVPAARGRGIALEASRALVRHLLAERGFHRLELEVYAFNETALRLADRVGYVREGVKRQAYRRHGRWNDAVLFSLLREDLDDAP
jgi:RimJ/RimL family protein N-acetyltransferase